MDSIQALAHFIAMLLCFQKLTCFLVHGQCVEEQRLKLLQLKASLSYNASESTKLTTWNSSADCCAWPGVSCNIDGLVVGLDLSNESISGGLYNLSHLIDLRHLESLNLAFNKFSFQTPRRLEELIKLRYLNLSNAGFIGQIPIEISHLTRLDVLDLSISTLFFGNVRSLELENPDLGTFVQNFAELRELYLDGVNISADGKKWCEAVSSSLHNLQVLSLSNCHLSGPIDASLANLEFLTVINLNGNNFSASVPEFLTKFSRLSGLHLSYCGLLGVFPKSILQMPSLQVLELSQNNQLSGSLPEFHQNQSLEMLLLTETNFSGELPVSLSNLTRLSVVGLAHCNFTGQIPNSITNLTHLAHLDFSSNTFKGPIPSFYMLEDLILLDLSRNQLSGEIPSTHFEGLRNLSYIDLSSNNFTGSIPYSLFEIPSLRNIQLSNNQFGGRIPDFPNRPATLLNTLDLSSNNLTGPVPAFFFNLSGLNVLSLSFNNFDGSIQLGCVQNLVNLSTLDLSHNKFNVEVSHGYSVLSFPKFTTLKLASCNLKVFPELGNQSQLYYLDLSNNQIPGEVPSWVSQLTERSLIYLNLSFNLLEDLRMPFASFGRLSILDVRNNQLRGEIPLPPPFATYVDYSNNKFTSSIPPDVGDFMFFTTSFSLANNGLTGVIPESICKAGYLQVLDVSNNVFNGTIPQCLIENTATLGVLNLRGNNFGGTIPDNFQGHCTLQTLDLSSNRLRGTFPKSMANCTRLEVLDLANNQINDEFPCLVQNLSSLRVLVLQRNNFHGEIRCPGIHNTQSMLQIVDLSINLFTGILPRSWFTSWKAIMGDGNEANEHIKFDVLSLSKLYYLDSVTVTAKNQQMVLVKILTAFTSIDFSSNNFKGTIPETIGELKGLYFLNLSHNALSGPVPSFLGNLSQLESLDLSVNNLTGSLPQQLADLTFLSVANFSFNKLSGGIPKSTQLQSFSPASFEGNDGLCGLPLPKPCSNISESEPPPSESTYTSGSWIKQNLISCELGYIFGLGAVIGPLIFCKKWRMHFSKQIDCFIFKMFPKRIMNCKSKTRRIRRKRQQ